MSDSGITIRMTTAGWQLATPTRVEGTAAPRSSPASPRVLATGQPQSPDFAPAAVLCWDDFASVAEHDAWFAHIRELESLPGSSFSVGAVSEGAANAHLKKILVYRDDPWIREHVLPQIDGPMRIARRYFGMDGIPFGQDEVQVNASGEDDAFPVHCDDGDAEHYSRMLTFVYYLHRHPRAFSGGELRVFDSRREDGLFRPAPSYVAIEPRDNRLVFFPSDRFHAVTRVEGPITAFEDRRITVNGWYWAREGVLPPFANQEAGTP